MVRISGSKLLLFLLATNLNIQHCKSCAIYLMREDSKVSHKGENENE